MRFFRLSDDNPLTGWHMLVIVCAFFGVVIAVNITLAVEATGTFPGLVVENSYVASQHYDDLLARARAQAGRGFHDRLAAEGGLLRFSLADRDGGPLRGLDVVAHVGRPSTTAEDRKFDLVPAADGAYVASEALGAGLWEVDLEAGRGSETIFRKTQEIFVNLPEARS